MPYSRNPDKYPLELQQLPHLLRNAQRGEYNIPAKDLGEAKGRRTQIQSFFAAVEKRAQELRQAAGRLNASNNARTDAQAIAELWEDRARTVAGWMVRTMEQGGQAYVQIIKRTTGDFGKALDAVFADTPRDEQPVPPLADSLEAQLALLRSATQQLEQNLGKTD